MFRGLGVGGVAGNINPTSLGDNQTEQIGSLMD